MLAFTPLHQTLDSWLSAHPSVLGSIVLGVSLILVISGVWGLKSGKPRSKFNTELTGSRARWTSWLRIVGGLLFGAWSLFLLLS